MTPEDIAPASVAIWPSDEAKLRSYSYECVSTFLVVDRLSLHYSGWKLCGSEGLAKFFVRDRVGFCDEQGYVVIPAKFEYAEEFADGRSMVRCDRKYGYIDDKGTCVIDTKFDAAASFCDGLGCGQVGDKWGLIGVDGRWIKEPIFAWLEPVFGRIKATTTNHRQFWLDNRGNLKTELYEYQDF